MGGREHRVFLFCLNKSLLLSTFRYPAHLVQSIISFDSPHFALWEHSYPIYIGESKLISGGHRLSRGRSGTHFNTLTRISALWAHSIVLPPPIPMRRIGRWLWSLQSCKDWSHSAPFPLLSPPPLISSPPDYISGSHESIIMHLVLGTLAHSRCSVNVHCMFEGWVWWKH